MDTIEEKIILAQENTAAIECLLSDYLPFIKKQLMTVGIFSLEYDDMLSLAMITFVNCIKQYDKNKGNFLSFAGVSIKNRIIDESRKQRRYSAKVIALNDDRNDTSLVQTAEENASILAYSKEQERVCLVEEINLLSEELMKFEIKFSELPTICPKQSRARNQCIALAKAIIDDGDMKSHLMKQHRIAQAKLAEQFCLSPKTIEKHRKYIVTIVVLLLGDYPNIKAFLPQYQEVQ